MPRPYSQDLRVRLIGAVETGASARSAARLFDVSASTAVKWVARWRRTGSVAALPMGGSFRSPLDDHAAWILALVNEQPDLTLRTSAAGCTNKAYRRPSDRSGGSSSAMGSAEKKLCTPPSRTGRTWPPRACDGRCAKGQRLVCPVPHGHWKTTTFIAGLRHDAITAPLVIDRPMNGIIFKAYVEQMLAPTLSPGDIVIMDNLSSHKIDGVRQAIEDKGAKLLYLPPYSPDFNPIEMAFAKLKTLLRKAAERTVDALWDTIGQALDTFTPQECVNYFKHAGYA